MILKAIIKHQIQLIELQPEDVIFVLFDPEWIDVEQAQAMFQQILDVFPNRNVKGLYGTDIKIIKEEDKKCQR